MTGSHEIDLTGISVSHYRIVEKIGRGGMGVVYRAEDERLGRAVALKFFSSGSFGDEDALERFRREARAASALNHPSICTVHDIGEWQGRPFIVLEYLHGATLRDRLQDGPLQVDRVLEIAIQLSGALETAHGRGIIHRDIKPANVFLTTSGSAKILDFGLAKLTEDPLESISSLPTVGTGAGLTTPGTTIGTVAYMSPEQARGEMLDGRTDLFSMGVMLYEMVTGLLPFRGRTAAVVFKEILTAEPADPVSLRPDTPPQLSAVIRKLLAKDRESRYQSASEVGAKLRELRRISESGQLSVTGVTPATEPSKRPRRLLYLSAILATLIGALVLLWIAGGAKVVHAPELESIAILPFSTESGDPPARRLSLGLSNAIITRLLRLPGLKIASKSTAQLFREGGRTAGEIGADTGVFHVLDGSVERQGDRVRISAQLIDVRSDSHVWAESYDRDVSDILAVEDEIARRIAEALELKLSGDAVPQLPADAPAEPLTAYDYYLMGKSYFDLGLMEEAEGRLRRVKEIDPGHFSYPQLLLARIYESEHRYREGLAELDEFLELHPDVEMAADVGEWRDSLQLRVESATPQDASPPAR